MHVRSVQHCILHNLIHEKEGKKEVEEKAQGKKEQGNKKKEQC